MYEDGATECYVTAVYEFVANDETEPGVRRELVDDINAFTDDQGMEVAIFPGDLLTEIRWILGSRGMPVQKLKAISVLLGKAEVADPKAAT